MRKFFVISFLLVCQNIFCQEYHFDYYIEYKSQWSGEILSFFINNNHSKYYLFRNDRDGTNFEAGLLEENSNLIHLFELKNLSNSITINYKGTLPKKQSNYVNNYLIETSIEGIENNLKKLTIFAYSDQRRKDKKKYSRKMQVIFDDTETKIPKQFFNYFFHGTLIDREIEYPSGIPIKLNVEYDNGNRVEYNLTQKKQINTTIKANN